MKQRWLCKGLFESVVFFFALLLASFGYATYVEFPAAHAEGPVTPVIGFLSEPSDGEPLEIALAYLHANRAALGLTEQDLADVVVKDQYTSRHNGVTHIYLRQQLNGMEVFNGDLNINITSDGRVINVNNDFVGNLAQAVAPLSPSNIGGSLSASEAVERAAEELGLSISKPLEVQSDFHTVDNKVLLSDGGISQQDIPVKQIYQPLQDGTVRLAWDLEIYEIDGENYWSVRVDAANGQLLDVANWVIHDDWGQHGEDESVHLSENEPVASEALQSRPPCTAPEQYYVYPWPIESPNHGERSLVSNPADPIASPFGWHTWHEWPGPQFFDTRGNNVEVHHSGYKPNGGPNLCFNFNLDLRLPPHQYQDAAISNVFYWVNIIHDLFYQYGFDEVSGNFQKNNYGKGGLGGDDVQVEVQMGGNFNNAKFTRSRDGQNPKMALYLSNNSSPQRDGALDSGIIAHEYGHGISTRLAGGRYKSNCFDSRYPGDQLELQDAEGWSDWFALVLTAQAGDLGSDARGIATYGKNQPPTGPGIRPAPYSTDMSINKFTYGHIRHLPFSHERGFVWGSMLWEMYWNLVEVYGFDPDLYHGTGGNNIALQLVIDGLREICHPGFVNARDGILQADRNNNQGANECLLWRAFAKRGLGVDAHQGDPDRIDDGHEGFNLPSYCTSAKISLLPGWNLVSIPLQLPPASEISQLLRPITGHYEKVYAYDGCAEEQRWKIYDPKAEPFVNTLTNVDETMGLWVKMSITDTLVVTGTVASETTIRTCSGWNLVGYPELHEQPVTDALHSINDKYSAVYAYLPDIWYQFDPKAAQLATNSLEHMSPGKGYWLKSNEDLLWTISPR